MTITTLATYEQAIALQMRLVRCAVLPRVQHDVAEGYETLRDTVWIHCTCGHWLEYPADASEQLYAEGHVARALRTAVAA